MITKELAQLGGRVGGRIAVASQLILLLSLACVGAQIVIGGRVLISGRVEMGVQASPAVGPGLVVTDVHYSINFPSNDTTFAKLTNGPTLTLSWTNHQLTTISAADPVTYHIYFKTQGSPSYVTNWTDSVWAGSVFADNGELLLTVDAYTDGYGSGTHVIASSINTEDFWFIPFTTFLPIDSGSITPAPTLYWTVALVPWCFDPNGAVAVDQFQLILNSP